MPVLDTIISVVEKTYKVYEALKTIHEAPEMIKSLQFEVVRVRGLLVGIIETTGDDEDMRGKCEDVFKLQPDLIEQARLLTEAANKFLEKATRRKEDGTLEVKSGMWLLNVSEAKDLVMKFSAFHGAVSAIYAVNTSASIALAGPSMIRAVDEIIIVRHEIAGVNETVRQTIREEWVRLFEEHQEAMARTMVRTMMSMVRDQREGRSQLFDELSILRDNPQATHESLDSDLPLVTQETRKDLNDSLIKRPSTGSLDDDRQSIMTSATCDSLDTVSPRPRPADHDPNHIIPQARCPPECSCHCHQSSIQCHLMPSTLTHGLWMHTPRSLISSLASPTLSCDDMRCARHRQHLLTMRRLFPTWHARIEGTIRSRFCPIHFKIQTPRIVESLSFLNSISLDEFTTKLTNREITVNDTRQDGFTILHVLVVRTAYVHGDRSEIYEMMHLAVNSGARYDWEYCGFTATEYMVYKSKEAARDTSIASATLESFDHNVAKPLFGEDVAEAWDSLREKYNWSDLHYLVTNPPSSPAQLKHDLAVILSRPSVALDVNAKDRFGWSPLHQAICSCPEAMDALLRAGANPHLVDGSPLGYAAYAHSWSAVGPLVRAGVNVNQRIRWPNGTLTAPLHDVILVRYARPGDRLRTALELVRHGGHRLDWDIQDANGGTPLDRAEWYMKEHPNDEEAALLYDLHKTQKLPPGAHLIDGSCLEHKDGVVNIESMSLVKAGIEGKTSAIGALISAGAMVNECDEDGRTLLHLVAMGVVPNGYAVAIELVRHGGFGVDWDALTVDGQTAESLAEQTLEHLPTNETKQRASFKNKLRKILPFRMRKRPVPHYKITCEDAAKILELLRRRALPQGIDYIYPCMDP